MKTQLSILGLFVVAWRVLAQAQTAPLAQPISTPIHPGTVYVVPLGPSGGNPAPIVLAPGSTSVTTADVAPTMVLPARSQPVYLQPNGVPVGDQAIILTQAPGAPVMVEQLPPPLVSPTIPPGQAVPNAPGKPNPMATYKPLAPIPYRTDTSEFRKHLGELAAERTELDKLRQNLKELSADRAYENEKEQIRQKIQDLILKRGAQILRAPARAQVTYDEPPTVAPQTQPRLPDQFEPPLKPKPMPMIPEKPAVEPVIEPRSVFISSAIPGAAESGLLAAQNYFMLAKYREALEQCERIDLLRLHPDDKQATLFLKATCLRKLGSLKESAEAYKEVIVMEGDEMLVECAQWHIQGIRWRLETDANLQKLKQRRIALEQSLREEKQP